MEEDDMGIIEWPEELINRYVMVRTATGNITSGLGTLALLWSTVVLLGGFVGVLRIKEFWVLTGLSILMACRVVDNYENEFKRGIYLEDAKIIGFVRRQKWIRVGVAWHHTFVLAMLLPKSILLVCLSSSAFTVTPFVSMGVSVWRLVRRDYGDAGGDIANRAKLTAALDLFYVLILFQSLFVLYWAYLHGTLHMAVLRVAEVTKKQCGDENWSPKVVAMYCSETTRKFNKDREIPKSWNLITYAVGLLHSAFTRDDDHLWGARVLDKLFDKKDIYVRQELLSSRSSVQNLIGMIGRRATADNIESRERAARIVAHLANDLQITHFPGILPCICSLLESCNQFCETCPSSEKNPDEQRSLITSDDHQHDAHMVVPIENQTDHEQEQVVSSSSAGLAQRKRNFLQAFRQGFKQSLESAEQLDKDIKEWRRFTYKSKGAKELISRGLLILERLAQDEENCTEISKHQRLLSKITSPLRSHEFLANVRDKKMVEMLSRSLTVVGRLLTSPGDGTTRLRQELASNTEAVSNLMGILETDSEGAQQLHQQALEILTELAFDHSFKKLDFNRFFKALVRIFLEEEVIDAIVAESNGTTVEAEQADREKATRLRGKAGEALAKLLPIGTARDVNITDILSKQEAVDLLSKVLNQILSTAHGSENQSEEREFMAAMLSLSVVMCNENVVSKDDFYRATPEDAEMVQKLKEVLEINSHSTAECLRVVKLTCQVVIAMIQAKPSCTQHFNEHHLKEALTEALETMSEVDDCMFFSGNDREVIKPARSLASLVKETQERLHTAPAHGN